MLQQALRRQHVLHFAGADAERQRSKRSVRRRVAVAADHRHARLRQSQLRTDHMHDALLVAAQRITVDAEVLAILDQLLHLRGRDLIHDRQPARRGRRAVVRGRDRQIRPPHLQPARAQPVEGLRRRHFVHQVQIDIEQRWSVRPLRNHVVFPDLFDDRARFDYSYCFRYCVSYF